MQGCVIRFLLDLPLSFNCFALHQLKAVTSGEIRCKKMQSWKQSRSQQFV